MIKVGIKSVFIGFIITACIRLIYPVEQIGVLVGINIALIVVSFIILFADKKKDLEIILEKENSDINFKKDIMKVLEDKSVLEELLNQLKDRKELNDIIDELKNNLEEMKSFEHLTKNGVENILLELKKKEKTEEIIISELRNKKELINVLEEIKSFEALIGNLKEELLIAVKDREKEEELVELNKQIIKVLKSNNGENIINSIEELNGQLVIKIDENRNALKRSIKDIEGLLEELLETTTSQLENYKEITNKTAIELSNAAKENRINIELLQDSYKILNSLMEN